jgi:type I restriction-modification system DNA methylase subunit
MSSTSSNSASDRPAEKADLLYQVIGKFAEIDLQPEAVSNIEMGCLYEELIRRFSEPSNESAGERFTPREVIRLMVDLLFVDDADDVLTKPGTVKTVRSRLRHGRNALCARGPPPCPHPASEV